MINYPAKIDAVKEKHTVMNWSPQIADLSVIETAWDHLNRKELLIYLCQEVILGKQAQYYQNLSYTAF